MTSAGSVIARHRAFALIMPVLCGLYGWLAVHGEVGAQHGDGLVYVNTARHFAPYWPPDPLAALWAQLSQFPPGYAALLAATGGAADLRLAHLATTTGLLAAFVAAYAWMLGLGIGRTRAAVATLLFALAPGTFLQSLYLHPEGLYVALAFAALLALAAGERQPRPAAFWAASAAVAAAILVRTVGVCLLPALALALWRARPRGWAGMLALAVAPGLAWSLAHQPNWSYSDQLLHTYGGASAGQALDTLLASVRAAVAGLADNLLREGALRALAHGLAAVAGLAALWRFARLRPDAWYVAAYAVVMAVWPYPQEAARLTWVMTPFLVGYALWAGQRLAERAPGAARAALAWAPAAALALAVLPATALLLARATHPLARPEYRHYPEWYEPDLARARTLTDLRLGVIAALKRFAEQVPPDQCVFSATPYLIASFYLPRDLRPPPPEGSSDHDFAAALQAAGCRYFLFTAYVEPRLGFGAPLYPLERVRDRVTILDRESLGDQLIAALGVVTAPE